jgi:trigger factor
MQIKREILSPTSSKLSVVADMESIESIRKAVLKRLASDVKLPGFREGKAPSELIEKQIDQALYQNEFLNDAINQLYEQAIRHEKLGVVNQPEITITKFVPFSALEFSADIENIGEVKLADYKTIKIVKKKIEVTDLDVNKVLEDLRTRAAEKKEVSRPAKIQDEVSIDFKGVDAKTSEPIDGADGKAYPLILGSNTFIPGFEDKLIGLKTKQTKSFDITFPVDYPVASLTNRKIKFDVIINSVSELKLPKLDDIFASKIGPFKTLSELKADIKKQLLIEKEKQADQVYSDELLQALADKSTIALPESLVKQEVDRMEEEEKRNLVYRGQTWQEHLKAEGLSEKEHADKQRPLAETRVKTGLILGEIAEKERIVVTPEELDVRLSLLKDQYSDNSMQSELEKPESKRDIYNRLMIEKTIDKLKSLNKN